MHIIYSIIYRHTHIGCPATRPRLISLDIYSIDTSLKRSFIPIVPEGSSWAVCDRHVVR